MKIWSASSGLTLTEYSLIDKALFSVLTTSIDKFITSSFRVRVVSRLSFSEAYDLSFALVVRPVAPVNSLSTVPSSPTAEGHSEDVTVESSPVPAKTWRRPFVNGLAVLIEILSRMEEGLLEALFVDASILMLSKTEAGLLGRESVVVMLVASEAGTEVMVGSGVETVAMAE
jgi:hypothetical protein